jgi:hypothetical protein
MRMLLSLDRKQRLIFTLGEILGVSDAVGGEGRPMVLRLPQRVATYFNADKEEGEAVAQRFTATAVVKDERQTCRCRAAIRQWEAGVSTRYQYTSEPFACEQKGGQVVVACRLTDNFPGSPVILRFFFGLEGEKIAALEIIP